jgi:hypothetical protein
MPSGLFKVESLKLLVKLILKFQTLNVKPETSNFKHVTLNL